MQYSTDCLFTSNKIGDGLALGSNLPFNFVIDSDTQKHKENDSTWTPSSREWVLSELFTKELLEELARGDLGTCSQPAWGEATRFTVDSIPTCNSETLTNSARRVLTTDELTIYVRQLQYQFKFQSEKEQTYIVSWYEKTVSDSGGEGSYQYFQEMVEGDGTVKTVGTYTIEPPTENGYIEVVGYNVKRHCKCSGDACPNGPQLGSVQFSQGLGGAGFDRNAGFLYFHSERPAAKLWQPAGLKYSTNAAFTEVIANSSGLQQVKAPEMMVNAVANGPYQYHLQVFASTNVGSKSGGLYTTNGPAYVTWIIENPDASTTVTNRLRIREVNPLKTITNEFTWTDSTKTWEFISGNGLKKETKQTLWTNSNTMRIKTVQVKEADNTLVASTARKYQVYSWGEGLAEEIIDPGGLNLSTKYGYGASSDDKGLVTHIVRWDGSWETLSYSQRKLVSRNSAFLDSNTNGSPVHSVSYCYTSNCVAGAGDNVSLEPYVPRSADESYPSKSVYSVILPGEKRFYQAPISATWSGANNLATIIKFYTNGTYADKISSIKNSDGTMQFFEFSTNSAGTLQTNISYSGAPNAGETAITNGTKTITVIGNAGQLHRRTVFDVASGLTVESETYSLDSRNRPVSIAYLDGTTSGMSYECCGLSASTNRGGTVTTYGFDDLKRRTSESQWITSGTAISTIYQYRADGSSKAVVRQGTNGSTILISGTAQDMAGRPTFETNAAGVVTAYSYGNPNSSGQRTNIATYASGTADESTRVEVFHRDGRLKRLTGTAVHPVAYEYTGGSSFQTDEIVLDGAGSSTSEKRATIEDFAGRVTQRTIWHGAGNTPVDTYSDFNKKGQLWRQRTTSTHILFTNSTSGELEYTVLDLDQDAVIDFNGTDRITRSISDVVSGHGTTVRRTRTYAWPSNSVDAALLVHAVETSADGLQAWDTALGQTASSVTAFAGGGIRYVTNILPDASYVISQFQHGRIVSAVSFDSTGSQLSSISYGYDAFGRQSAVADARNGTTTFTFDNMDRATSVRTPSPGSGGSAQTTTNFYDNLGRIWKMGLPDGGSVTNEYYASGELKRTYGTRTYPVEFLYDTQGRLRTNSTWQGFITGSSKASTVWNYDSRSGILTSKAYADSAGTSYAYHTGGGTPVGLLSRRTWQRGSTADYAYNNAGEISSITYGGSPSLGTLTLTYDRLGRWSTIAQGSMTTTFAYNDANRIISESYSGGELSGLAITNTYDSLQRRTNSGVLLSSAYLTRHGYSYDAASRLDTVSDGTNSAAYSYEANSPMIKTVTYKQNSNTRMVQNRSWDYLNRLTSIAASNSSAVTLMSHAFLYNDGNQRTKATFVDGSYWIYQYDALGQVTSGKRYWADGTIVAGQQFEYAFDDIGNRTTVASGGDTFGANLRYQNYTPNLVNQYSQRTVPGYMEVQGAAHANAAVTVNQQPSSRKGEYFRCELSADNSINPLYLSITNIAVLTNGIGPDILTTSTGNSYLPKASVVFSHDADGNLTNDGRWALAWDTENRLLSLTAPSNAPSGSRLAVHFGYDPRGRRISKVVSNWTGSAWTRVLQERYLYDGWNLLAALNGTNNAVVKTFCWGNDLSGSEKGAGGVSGLLWMNVTGQGFSFPAYDGNGNVMAMVSASTGLMVAQYEYGPFGEVLRANGTLAKLNPIRFSTKYQDDESDFLYYGYRYLSTTIGRWLSRDPLGEFGGVNRYGFVDNHATTAIDSLGLDQYKVVCSAANELDSRIDCNSPRNSDH